MPVSIKQLVLSFALTVLAAFIFMPGASSADTLHREAGQAVQAVSQGHSLSSNGTLLQQLFELNRQWMDRSSELAALEDKAAITDDERCLIQTHLRLVIHHLETTDVSHLSGAQLSQRLGLIESLKEYQERGQFPVNVFVPGRRPVFIDPWGTHCAVGYLIAQSGHSRLAIAINREHRLDYLHEIKTDGLAEWQRASGLTLDELALIQPTYNASSLRYPKEIEELLMGNPALFRTAIEAGDIKVDARCGGKTPLHFAAAVGDLKLVQLLVEKGADLQEVSKSTGVSIKNTRGQFQLRWNQVTSVSSRLGPGSGLHSTVYQKETSRFVANVLQDAFGGLEGKTAFDYATLKPAPNPYTAYAARASFIGSHPLRYGRSTDKSAPPAMPPETVQLEANRAAVAKWIRDQDAAK